MGRGEIKVKICFYHHLFSDEVLEESENSARIETNGEEENLIQ